MAVNVLKDEEGRLHDIFKYSRDVLRVQEKGHGWREVTGHRQ